MTRLEELFVRWHDGQIEDAELRELNAALREPESRKQLMAAFQFHAELLQSLQSLRAVEQTAQSAHDFQTLELRDSEPFSSSQSRARSWFAGLKQLRPRLGIPALAYSFAAMVVAALTFFFFASSKRMAVLDGNIAGVTIVRSGQAFPGKAGFALRPGDRVKTSGDNNAFVRYVAEPTQIKLLAGTQLRLDQDSSGKHLEVLVGTISAKVAPQPAGHPMMVATPHSDAKIIGTEFVLTVDSASTHLEVIEGSVQLCNREDGKAVVVSRDHFATVAKGADLVTRSLLPAPWNSQDIGAVGMTGYARIEGHRCKIKAAGKSDAKSKDQYHFLYQTLEADGEIRARVVDVELTHNLAKAGVIIRDNLKPNSPQAFLYLKAGSGLEFEHRVQSQSVIDRVGIEAAPYWLRLARHGEWIYAYKSADGQSWQELGSDRIKMRGKIYLGLGVSSWNNSKLTTSIFDNVTVLALGTNGVTEVSQK